MGSNPGAGKGFFHTKFIKVPFLKVATTTLVDLLFIELMSHFSIVKQMYSQSIHRTNELILCIQIIRGMEHFNRNTTMKSPC